MQLMSAVPGLAALIFVAASFAQTPPELSPRVQAISPDLYPKLPVNERQSYVAGVLDTDRLLFRQSQAQFVACLNGETIAQVTDVVDRSLPTLEPVLRTAMPVAVLNALIADCERRGFKGSRSR
ncbi:hypothetical protein [Paraburkholderia fungorum]|jgi:hypothetical protein|uniref:Uncharacterized protein n=1 Tax=Paraburkholderia fungorum TaxID=134537 RepID=A0AAW3V2B1_9BURK|nr:hypothetical protein [Paraburkholderia fungorum]AJZ56218.1 hypothetical protein OI25_8179 [Paraburkholderia fungorum]MBB4516483.1 hypothetical protein [Paraburkholderia fungorum]MBB6205044.1 hypothetical protein [Paraburkholderia fungorum]MBU7440655.1 hypothetical protein [Paraburkholderia fungorum]MDE1007202.1 hypothetical protein [Paraburkholderia fungorum]